MRIENRQFGRDASPFVVAEMSDNHNQSLERALGIVEAAAKAGAHALKIQTYTPDTMTLDIVCREGELLLKTDLRLFTSKIDANWVRSLSMKTIYLNV